MHPFRLLIIGILLYILYRLLMGALREKLGSMGAKKQDSGLPSHDILVQDPVCKTYVAKGQALMVKQGRGAFYFCSEKCKSDFLAQKGGAR
ncbi:MAG: YHS domain-containing protein [Desulfobulbaceae bacterium]|nr:YHS domain-containing protein [Desulfobulbaceae bacterium]HIJ79587.1 YHS domain-containing protein [Deltaproteobacteria bacterium]